MSSSSKSQSNPSIYTIYTASIPSFQSSASASTPNSTPTSTLTSTSTFTSTPDRESHADYGKTSQDDRLSSHELGASPYPPSEQPKSTKGLLGPMSKSKSRLTRLSSFFPSLINSHPTDHQSAGSISRKPLPVQSPVQDRPPSLPPRPNDQSNGPSNSSPYHPSDGTAADSPSSIVNQGHSRNPSGSNGASSATESSRTIALVAQEETPTPSNDNISTPPPESSSNHFNFNFNLKETKASPQLSKDQRRRSSSAYKLSSPQPGLLPRHDSEPKPRSSSAQPPSDRTGSLAENRVVSATAAAIPRPGSSNGSQSPTRDTERRGRFRRSFLPGGRSRSQSQGPAKAAGAAAWILGQNVDYNTSFLANGERVPELWNEHGDIYVYLDPKGSGSGPSFKVPSFAVDHSLVFADLIEAEMSDPTSPGRSRTLSFSGRGSLSAEDATRRVQSPPISPPSPEPLDYEEPRLYLPVSMSTPGHRSESDMERLISIRNMFAFLTGQPLVGTKAQPTHFSVFLHISALLKEFEFTNADGSSFGEAVNMSFSFVMEQMALADVRHSREKTLESLILGERMRSVELYNEAFSHTVGKYLAIRDLKSSLWEQVSPLTRERLERAHLDLMARQNAVNNRLEAFEFPALFSGTANSTSTSEYKDVKFHTWKKSFGRMRQFVLNYYRSNFGSWPPKARSKKNPFTESGLNRLVLKILYSDLCALYDLLVDRESLTTRVIDQSAEEIANDDRNPNHSAMRKVLGEFDQSSPPVLPPIPFDLPKLPSMTSVKENFYELSAKEQSRLERNLQDYEILLILNKAYDFETFKLRIPFLGEFKDFEYKEAKGKTASEMADQRLGYWLFLYVVIQSLPMLVVDAPGLKCTEGVEYFLCQPPKGQPPWIQDAPIVRKRWYEVAGGGGLVELSADAVEFSIEGIYHRSHCWLAAKRWEFGEESAPPAPPESLSPLQAPQSVFTDMDPGKSPSPTSMGRSDSPITGPPGAALRPRTRSPNNRHSAYRSSIALGLEPIPLPQDNNSMLGPRVVSARGVSPGPRPTSAMMGRSRSSGNLQGLAAPDSRNSSRQESVGGSTFDDILKDMEQKPKKKKGFF